MMKSTDQFQNKQEIGAKKADTFVSGFIQIKYNKLARDDPL